MDRTVAGAPASAKAAAGPPVARANSVASGGGGPRRRWKKVSVARALWLAWAIIVWNVVFDHVIVLAGRDVLRAAGSAVATALNIDAFMRPAVTQALWIATVSASAIVLVGLSSIHLVRSR
jgi:hypothetical protein